MDIPELSIRGLDALFDQSPVAMIFTDSQMRARRANTAFRQMMGVPKGDLIGHPLTQQALVSDILDTRFVERTLTEQVIGRGVPVVNVPLELNVAGEHKVAAWTAYRVTDNGRVLGVVSTLVDVTDQARASVRLDLLQRAGSEIGTTLDVRRTARELTVLAAPGFADRVTVDLIDLALAGEDPSRGSSGELVFRRYAVLDTAAAGAGNLSVGEQYSVLADRQPARVYLRGEPILARSLAEIMEIGLPPVIMDPLVKRGVHTTIEVPLTARGVTLGVVGFVRSRTPEPFNEADLRLACDLTSRAALHIDNARLYTREHDAAVTLQRSLLPREVPQVAGLDIAWRYQPASQVTEIGGDWFDVTPLDDGQVTLVVGDVTGHGIHAAATMGQLRTTTAALTRLGSPPQEIMHQLSSTVAAHGSEAGATCLYAHYDPASRLCRLTSAGHPPPVIRYCDGSTEIVDLAPGLLLGAGHDTYVPTEKTLAEDCILAMYTDGLIERPGEDLGAGLARLARALAEGPTRSLDELCESVLTSLAPHPRDDVALLLARATARS
jgi:PAS domain S-box-containing protein